MGSLQSDIGELAHHLKQEKLFLEAEKQQIQHLNEKVSKTCILNSVHSMWFIDKNRVSESWMRVLLLCYGV